MIAYERQQQLLSLLQEDHCKSVRELAQAVFSSEASVRRDLDRLEKQGLVRRVYGGVLLAGYAGGEVPLAFRRQENNAVKDVLARRAAELVRGGSTVFLDASSTVWHMVRYLEHAKTVKVITNSAAVTEALAEAGLDVWCTGGRYIRENRAFAGPEAEAFLRGIHMDMAFFSCAGLSADGEISDGYESETALRRVLLGRAQKRVFLCDSSKLGVRETFTLCTKDEVDLILCDAPLPWADEA